MTGPPGPVARPAGAVDRRARLTREEFDVQFQAAAGTLWCIAVAVLGGGRTDAEDVIQDAAAIGFTKIDAFDPSTSFAAWMGEIVRNVARNHARKHDRRRTSPTDPAAIDVARAARPSEPPAALDAYARVADEASGFDDQLLAALRTLEETPRACLLLRTLEDMPYRDIARVLNIPEGTAMSHVHRTRAVLRKLLT